MKLAPVATRKLTAIDGAAVAVPDRAELVHLQFRRFAGCPICDLHLRSFGRRHDEIRAAGIREVAVFHSSAESLREQEAGRLPFAVIADPTRRYYREFGVEAGARALLDPRVWPRIILAIAASLWRIFSGQHRFIVPDARSGRLGLPADFLIHPDGRVLASKYGEHAADQWSVDELLSLVASEQLRHQRNLGPLQRRQA